MTNQHSVILPSMLLNKEEAFFIVFGHITSSGHLYLRWRKTFFLEEIYDGDLRFEDDINLANKEEEQAKTAATAKFTISNPWKRGHGQLLPNSKRYCFRKQSSIMAVISFLSTKFSASNWFCALFYKL